MDLVALKTELTNDPQQIGYAAVIGDHVAVSRLLNRSSRTIDKETLPSGVLVACLDKSEFTALSAPDKAWLTLFITATDVPMTRDVRQTLWSLFPLQNSKTRQNINQATKREASRAEELGFGRVTESDVADALRI